MNTVLHDIQFAVRTLRRSPAFFAAAALTIALSMGATTAIFTAVDRIVLRPLPFPDSERVMLLCETNARVADRCVASPSNVADWTTALSALQVAGVARSESSVVSQDGMEYGVAGAIVTPGFFKVLSLRAAQGRLLDDNDLHPATNRVVVVSDQFWRQRLGGRPDIVGQSIRLDGRPYQVVGVMAPDAYLPLLDTAQLWRPLTTSIDDTSRREWRGFIAIAKRAAGTSASGMRRQLEAARVQLANAYPAENADWGLRVESLREHIVGSAGATLWLFLVAVGVVLAITCVNVAGLLLVRTSARSAEFAVRASLGAARGRLVRQFLTECAVIAVTGGAAGWLLAVFATRALIALAPSDIPRLSEVHPDLRIAAFTLILSVTTAVLFGFAPARAATRFDASALKAGREVNPGASRTHAVLVVAELTLSMVLLVTAGLLTKSFARLSAWDPGFERSGLSVAWTFVSSGPGVTTKTAVPMLEQLRDEVAATAGVDAVGLGSAGPLFGGTESGTVALPTGQEGGAVVANWFDVDRHYFETIGRRVLLGRDFAHTDVDGAAPVAIVNDSFARRLFAGGNPIGQVVTVQTHQAQIVGVVSDVRPVRPDRLAEPEIFWPIRQYPRLGAYLVIRSRADRPALDRAIQTYAGAAGLAIQAAPLVPIERGFERTLVSPRFNLLLIGAFAVLAVLLAAIGVYGVLAYSVSRRTREIGLRLALGASPGRLLARVIGRAMTFAVIGITSGLGLSLLCGRLLSSWLYGLSPADPTVLGVAVVVMSIVALIAGYMPARRASQVDPIVALRPE